MSKHTKKNISDDRSTQSRLAQPSPLKLRLKYLKDTYFANLDIAELSRRLSGQVTNDSGAPTGTPDYLVSKGVEQLGIRYRALATQFDPEKTNIPDSAAIRKIVRALARHYIWDMAGGIRPPDAEIVDRVTDQLAIWVETGSGSPYLSMMGHNFPAIELSFEHLEELKPAEQTTGSPFAALSSLSGFLTARSYLRGAPADDWAVLRHVAIERPKENELIEAVTEEGSRVTVLTSSAGDGRTTLIKRVAMRLREAGWRVFFVSRPNQRQEFPRLPNFRLENGPTCIIVDDAERATDYAHLEDDVVNQPGLRVILSSRWNAWQSKKTCFNRARSITLDRLSENEIELLAAVISEFDAASPAASVAQIEDRLRVSVDSDYPHLLAAMLTATQGKSFETIIESMIDSFHESGDDWCLKVVAAFSFVDELSFNRSGRIAHHALRATLASDLKRTGHTIGLGDKVSETLRRVRSEVISLPVDRGFLSTTEYDLRHPDIVRLVVRRHYGLDSQLKPASVGLFMDDIADVAWDEIRADQATGRAGKNRWKPTTVEFARQLVACRRVPSAIFLIRIARHVFRKVLDVLGNYENERFLATGTLWYWGAEEYLAPDWAATIDEEGKSISDHIFLEALAINEAAAAATWANWLVAYQNNCSHDPRLIENSLSPYTARSLSREAWKAGHFRGAGTPAIFMNNFMNLEVASGNIGGFENPSEFTARWIAREAWNAGVRSEQLIADWIRLELSNKHLGDFESPTEFTARWIAREAWNAGVRSEQLVTDWIRLELSNEHLGDFESPTEFTARWIAREAWNSEVRPNQVVTEWIRLEVENNQLGSLKSPQEFTARWIARKAWVSGERTASSGWAWVALEKEAGNLGDPVDPEEFTARWIARQLWEAGERTGAFLGAWIELEGEVGNVGDPLNPEEFTARWVAYKLWEAGARGGSFLGAWIAVEGQAGNIGEEKSPAEFTARWIARKAWEFGLRTPRFFEVWIELEREAGNIGDSENPAEFSAYWIEERARSFAFDRHLSVGPVTEEPTFAAS